MLAGALDQRDRQGLRRRALEHPRHVALQLGAVSAGFRLPWNAARAGLHPVSMSDYASCADSVADRADIQLRLVDRAKVDHQQDQLLVSMYVCMCAALLGSPMSEVSSTLAQTESGTHQAACVYWLVSATQADLAWPGAAQDEACHLADTGFS